MPKDLINGWGPKDRHRDEVVAVSDNADDLVGGLELDQKRDEDFDWDAEAPPVDPADEDSYILGVKATLDWVLSLGDAPQPLEHLFSDYYRKLAHEAEARAATPREVPTSHELMQELDKEGQAKLQTADSVDEEQWMIHRGVYETAGPGLLRKLQSDLQMMPAQEAWASFDSSRRELLDFPVLSVLQATGGRWYVRDARRRWEDGLALPGEDGFGMEPSAGSHFNYRSEPHCPVCANTDVDFPKVPGRPYAERLGIHLPGTCSCGARWLERFELADFHGDQWDDGPSRSDLQAYQGKPACKVCGGTSLDRYNPLRKTEEEGSGPTVYAAATCRDCGDEWLEVYTLMAVRLWWATWTDPAYDVDA